MAFGFSIIPSGRYFCRKSTQNVGDRFGMVPHTPHSRDKGNNVPLANPLLTSPLCVDKAHSGKTESGKQIVSGKIYICNHLSIAELPQKMRLFAEKALFFEGGSGDNLSPDR